MVSRHPFIWQSVSYYYDHRRLLLLFFGPLRTLFTFTLTYSTPARLRRGTLWLPSLLPEPWDFPYCTPVLCASYSGAQSYSISYIVFVRLLCEGGGGAFLPFFFLLFFLPPGNRCKKKLKIIIQRGERIKRTKTPGCRRTGAGRAAGFVPRAPRSSPPAAGRGRETQGLLPVPPTPLGERSSVYFQKKKFSFFALF